MHLRSLPLSPFLFISLSSLPTPMQLVYAVVHPLPSKPTRKETSPAPHHLEHQQQHRWWLHRRHPNPHSGVWHPAWPKQCRSPPSPLKTLPSPTPSIPREEEGKISDSSPSRSSLRGAMTNVPFDSRWPQQAFRRPPGSDEPICRQDDPTLIVRENQIRGRLHPLLSETPLRQWPPTISVGSSNDLIGTLEHCRRRLSPLDTRMLQMSSSSSFALFWVIACKRVGKTSTEGVIINLLLLI